MNAGESWSVLRFQHDRLGSDIEGTSRRERCGCARQVFVVAILGGRGKRTAAPEVPDDQRTASAALNKRAGDDAFLGSAHGAETASYQPVHHRFIRHAVLGIAADGGVKEEPPEVPRAE